MVARGWGFLVIVAEAIGLSRGMGSAWRTRGETASPMSMSKGKAKV